MFAEEHFKDFKFAGEDEENRLKQEVTALKSKSSPPKIKFHNDHIKIDDF